ESADGVAREMRCGLYRRKRILPVDVVLGHRPEKREREIQEQLHRRSDSGPAPLPQGGDRRVDVPPQMAHPAADPIARNPLNGRAARPLIRSEEHTSELQSRSDLVCRLLLEKKKKTPTTTTTT